jgi:hypothetical protein
MNLEVKGPKQMVRGGKQQQEAQQMIQDTFAAKSKGM